MAAGESLSPYDDITSDELFHSFMDVVSSVEQSFNEEDIKNDRKLCENPYEDINDINGILSSDINIGVKKDEPSQFSTCIPSNDPVHLPLLVKMCKEPIYELCGNSSHNGDVNSPLDYVDSNTIMSNLDDPPDIPKTNDGNSDNCVYQTLDEVINSSPRHNISVNDKDLDGLHKIDHDNDINYAKTSNLDDISPENSFEIPTSSISEMELHVVTDEYATVVKENKSKTVSTDIYAVVNKENKSPEISKTKKVWSSNDNNVVSSSCNDIQTLPNSYNDVTSNNDYAEIQYGKDCSRDVLMNHSSATTEVVETKTDNNYEIIDNIKPSISKTLSANDVITSTSNSSPDIVFNAEQIAYGCSRYSKGGTNDIYQSCIQTIEEKSELLSPQTTKPSGKDKRHFFGFGKWKSTDDTSKSPTPPVASFSADDVRKEYRTLPTNCSSTSIPVLCSGYLFKQGGSGFIPKNWRLRWFHLKKDNCLYYYKSEQDQIPFGAVILLKYQVSRAQNVNKRFAFKLSKGGARTYYFAANSEDEMKKWMGYISSAVRDAISDHTSIPECSLKNVSIPATSITDTDCHGFIYKQGNVHKTWKKRFCVLKYGCLFYYEDIIDKVAIGVFKLHKYTIHKSENTRYGFEAVPPVRKMRTYYFYTNTETDTRRWMDAMRHSISSSQ